MSLSTIVTISVGEARLELTHMLYEHSVSFAVHP